ncbi:MAG: hypothetical protein P8N02_02910, partial [Actinomycetota bacterium]|nr:hypothetical protein [Actinomycetota bacterium]
TTALDEGATLERLAVDLTAVRQRVRELDRRVTALQLLTAGDDSRHVEQAIMHAATAATDLHKVAGLLGGAGLMDQLRARVEATGDPTLAADLETLAEEIDVTRRRVARSSALASAASGQLDRQLALVLGTSESSGEYSGRRRSTGVASTGPRLVDRLA